MILGNINNLKYEKNYSEVLQKAINYLKNTNFLELNTGVHYPFDSKDMFVQVIDLETKHQSEKKPEVHRKYVDVQFLVHGEEKIGFSVDTGNNKISDDYCEERDILFYSESENESFLNMTPGTFAVFFPNIVHRPGCAVNENSKIRKVVIKIDVKLLNN